MFFTPAACIKIKVLQNFIRAFFEYFHSLDSVIRRMFEIQHAVQYGYRLLHPTTVRLDST